jgi:hypothetical protein
MYRIRLKIFKLRDLIINFPKKIKLFLVSDFVEVIAHNELYGGRMSKKTTKKFVLTIQKLKIIRD